MYMADRPGTCPEQYGTGTRRFAGRLAWRHRHRMKSDLLILRQSTKCMTAETWQSCFWDFQGTLKEEWGYYF